MVGLQQQNLPLESPQRRVADGLGKGALDDPSNYRPIRLLSTAYKLLARILQQRLAAALDQHLRGTQYGFRMGGSTSQPVHVIRRLLEKAPSPYSYWTGSKPLTR